MTQGTTFIIFLPEHLLLLSAKKFFTHLMSESALKHLV